MHCKICNTRLGEGVRFCPNCGNDVGAVSAREGRPKNVRISRLPSRARKHDELELSDPADSANDLSGPDLSGPIRAPRRSAAASASDPGMLAPEPEAVREMLAGRLDLLESGLRIHSDEKNKPIGVDFSTDVGEIDLLARDGGGAWVVVMVAERGPAEASIAELLQRIGWVRKHLAKGPERVRGVLLLDQPPEASYAAAAVADTISFKTYRMSLCFEDMRV
jgi:hypothetical protein